MILVTVLVYTARRSRRSQVLGPLAAAVAIIGGGGVLFLAIFEDTRGKFARGDLSKLDLVKSSLGLLREHGVFGVGRGAFESVFPQLRTTPEYWVNTHPEDVVAQWTTEWGVPVAVLAMVAIAWALRPRTALARSRAPAGAWAALVAVAAHNLVDFSSEVPGVVIAMCVCAAIVTGGSGAHSRVVGLRERAQRAILEAWCRHPRALTIGLSASVVVAIAATLPFTADELYADQRSFRDAALDRTMTREQFHELAKATMIRHPAEPYFPFVGAVRAIVAHDESVLPWAARALDRSPVYGRVHLLIARSLFVKSRSQARLEYRLACEQDSTLCYHTEALPLVDGFDDAMELVPEGERSTVVLAELARELEARLPATSVRLDRELVARDVTALDPLRRVAAAALWDVQNEEVWCVPPAGSVERCIADGLAAAARIRASAPERCDGYALRAELRVLSGDVDAGFSELDEALDRIADRSACAKRLVQLAQRTRNAARVDASVDRLLKLGCEAPPECVDNLLFAAQVESTRGRGWRGLALLKKAWERAPEREGLLEDIGAKAEAQGFHGEALEAYTRLADRHPSEARWTAAVARERDAVARGVFQAQ
jgi:hypothetical protein